MEKILACLSPSPSNPKILRAAAAMARDGAELTALFIETPQYPRLAAADRRRLQENIQIAEQLGAKIQTVSGDDVAFQIAEYARLSDIKKVVLGQSDFKPSFFPSQASLPDRLAEYLPDAEIHVIPDRKRGLYFPPQGETFNRRRIVREDQIDQVVSAIKDPACVFPIVLIVSKETEAAALRPPWRPCFCSTSFSFSPGIPWPPTSPVIPSA